MGRSSGKAVNPKSIPWEGIKGRQAANTGSLSAALPALLLSLLCHGALPVLVISNNESEIRSVWGWRERLI